MTRFFNTVEEAVFLERPNRFIVKALYNGEEITCHMPNPGRMKELLFPGVTLLITPHQAKATAFRVIGIMKGQTALMLDTLKSNTVAEWLINSRQIPGWESYFVVKREITMGDSRFDLLLSDGRNEPFPVEVKTCTLFGKHGAMFPDAVTARGAKHVRELTERARQGMKSGILMLVQQNQCSWFLPDFHTDPEFAHAFRDSLPYVEWKIAGISWNRKLELEDRVSLLSVPEKVLERENRDRGCAFFVWKLDPDVSVNGYSWKKGYYVGLWYKDGELDRWVRHLKGKQKVIHNVADELRSIAGRITGIPIRSSENITEYIEKRLEELGIRKIDEGGHLFYTENNPWDRKEFAEILEDVEINRLDRYIMEP